MTPKPISIESEAGFRVLFESATISILVVDESGSIALANPCAERLFGYEPTELIGQAIEILIPESHRHRHIEHRETYFKKPKTRPMGLGLELYGIKKNNEVFPVEISLGHYELSGEKLAVAFVTDITDQVKARKIITEREAWFRNMADNSPVMIWVSGPDKEYNYFNDTWLVYTGRPVQEELGNGWTTGIHPEDLERYLVTYTEAFDDRHAFELEFRLRRWDGQYRWVHHSGKPTYTIGEIFTGFIGSCSDVHDRITDREKLEMLVQDRTKELQEALDREKEMNELKSRFVSMASHEFRTPLSIVLSSTALIEQYARPYHDERIHKHLLRIKSNVSTLTAILNDFLSLDKLEQGKVDMEYETFDFDLFMEQMVEGVSPMQKRGQRVKIQHSGAAEVTLDRKKLRYVLTNLVSNAIKYSPEKTSIHIGVEHDDGQLTVTVADSGIGIPAEQQHYLFDKFFRAHNTNHIQGTGLGLTIVKRYVELMNGEISFVSEEGVGTTFTIVLPTCLT